VKFTARVLSRLPLLEAILPASSHTPRQWQLYPDRATSDGDFMTTIRRCFSLRPLSRSGRVHVGLVAAIVLVFTVGASAQINSLGDAGSRPLEGVGHNYIEGLNETVNPDNGTLNIKISLPTPKGRGLTFPFALTYNSGSAHRLTSGTPGCGAMDLSSCASNMLADRAQQGEGWDYTRSLTSPPQHGRLYLHLLRPVQGSPPAVPSVLHIISTIWMAVLTH
jgi:hypothetical protein